MSQSFETFVPTLKHQKLLATAEAIALENEKVEDAKTLKQATDDAVKYFEQYRYWWINEGEMIFDRETGLLWQGLPDKSKTYNLTNAKSVVTTFKTGGLSGWELPSLAQLQYIAQTKTFPLQDGSNTRMNGNDYWMTTSDRFDTASGFWKINSGDGYIIAKNSLFQNNKTSLSVLNILISKNWKIYPFGLTLPHTFVDNTLINHASNLNAIQDFNNNKVFYLKSPFTILDINLRKAFISYMDTPLKQLNQNLATLDKLSKKKYDYKRLCCTNRRKVELSNLQIFMQQPPF